MPKTVMIPVYVPEDWHPVLKELAAGQGETLTAWFRVLAWGQIPKKKRKGLSEPAKRGNPTFGKKMGRPKKQEGE